MRPVSVRAGLAGQRGGALAETALTLPVLMLIFFGLMYFGMLCYTHIVVQLAANQGARQAAAALSEWERLPPEERRGRPTPEQQAMGMVEAMIAGALALEDLEGSHIRREVIQGQEAIRVTVVYRFGLQVPLISPPPGGGRVVRTAVYRIEHLGR